MFDTVATPRREDRARRAGSLLFSAALLGSLLGVALSVVPQAALPELVLAPMPVLVELGVPGLSGPPAPPSGGGGGGKRDPRPAPVAAPPEPAAEEAPPSETAPAEPSGSGAPTTGGPGDGPPGEGPPGEGPPGEGPPGGPPGGGSGQPGARAVHHRDLNVLTRVEPRFPEAARSFARSEERCTVRIEVNEEGVPGLISARTCPVVFERAAIEAARQWRWSPYTVDGKPTPASFDLQFVFRLHD